jgi:hypothetical protein
VEQAFQPATPKFLSALDPLTKPRQWDRPLWPVEDPLESGSLEFVHFQLVAPAVLPPVCADKNVGVAG